MVRGSGAARFGQSISRGNQCNPQEGWECLVQCINCWSVETGDWGAIEEWPWWGWSFMIKAAQLGNLAWSYTELLAKIHNTYSTSTYHFSWPVPRTYTRTCCFNLRVQVRISSTGPCHVIKTRMYSSIGPYHTHQYVGSTRFSLVDYVELMCSRVRIPL